jgi:cell division protein FtsB
MSLQSRMHLDPVSRARALKAAVWMLASSLLFNLVFGDMGIVQGLRQRALARRLRQEVARLQADNDALARDIQALKTDPFRVEGIARVELGLARPGEIVFLFPGTPATQRPASSSDATTPRSRRD